MSLLFFYKQCDDESMNTSQNPKPVSQLQILQMICLSMAGSVVVFGAVLFMIKPPIYNTELFTEIMRNPLHVMLFFLGVVAILIRVPLANTLLSKALESAKPQGLEQIIPHYQTAFILRVALAESAALMGFASTLLSGEMSAFMILAGAGLVAIIKEFPTAEKLKTRVNAVKPGVAQF